MNLLEEYKKIKTPEELLELMKYINYGYLGKNSKLHYFADPDFNEVWYEEYILEEPQDILKSKLGNCWDQTELERDWFEKNNYEYKTIYEMVDLDYKNPYPTHSFLVYKDNDNSWNWFENSDYDNRGIHKFNSLNELLAYQLTNYKNFLKTFNITDEELEKIVLKDYSKPNYHISAEEYLNHVKSSKDLML